MSSTKTDPTIVLDTGSSEWVKAVAFSPDRIHILGGARGKEGIRRWRLEDGQEVGKQTGMKLSAISVTKDRKWIVCGTEEGANVWDEEMQKKVIQVESGDAVNAVDVSPDSTMFATGSDEAVTIWRITSGTRLVGPLKHDFYVTAVRFSPNGERIATTSSGRSIRIFDSRNGDELITIKTVTPETWPITPLAWSNDGQRILAASKDNKVKSFDVSTGSQLAESLTLEYTTSIALAANGKFVATFALGGSTISFLDTSTLSQIGPVIEDSSDIWAIAISPNCGYLAAGLRDGKITIRDLGSILPDSYGPFHTSNREERQSDEQPSTSGSRHNKLSDSPEETEKSSRVESETRRKDRDDDLLEVEAPSGEPAPEFDFDEPPSPGSSAHCEDEVPPLDASHALASVSDTIPVIYPPLAQAEGHLDAVESSQGITGFGKWLQARIKKGNKDPTSHNPGRARRKSRRLANGRSSSQSPTKVDATNEGPSRMAAGQRVRRAVARPVVKRDPKPPAKNPQAQVSHPKKVAPRSGQGSAKLRETGPVAQANDRSHPSAGGVHLTRESGKATLRFSMTFPGWMCCGSSTGDET